MIQVDGLEEKIGQIVDKLEAALTKMANVERAKAMKKESMNKILDTLFIGNDDCKGN